MLLSSNQNYQRAKVYYLLFGGTSLKKIKLDMTMIGISGKDGVVAAADAGCWMLYPIRQHEHAPTGQMLQPIDSLLNDDTVDFDM